MIGVLVADDQSLIRQAVVDLLSDDPRITVLGQVADGAAAVRMAVQLRPDVVIMDIRMPDIDGIEATRAICAAPQLPDTRVLVLTTFEEDEYLLEALRAGASGFIGKGAEPEDIARAVRAVHAGDALLSPAATRNLIARFVLPGGASGRRGRVPPPEGLAQLTDRELEVLVMVGSGLSNQDIADELVISPHTAKTHVNRIMTKAGAHDRAQLVILAYESGLLRPGTG